MHFLVINAWKVILSESQVPESKTKKKWNRRLESTPPRKNFTCAPK